MAEHESGQERTEDPTPKRLREARERGQVPRSRELNGMAVMMCGTVGLLFLGPGMISTIMRVFERSFSLPPSALRDTGTFFSTMADALADALLAIAPLLGLVLLAALAAPALLGGWVLSAQQLAFKAEKLNPLKGLARIFSLRGLMELVKALAKFLIVAALATLLLWLMWQPLLGLRAVPLEQALADAGTMLAWAFLVLSCGLVVIAAVDAPFQLLQHRKQLRMTRQEVRDELKESEGKPEVRSRIRQLQLQLAQARMMEEVPSADVVITNPTHVSVALRYDERRMRAPIVVAKGVDLIALRIREVAREHQVAIVPAPLLARVLNASTELRQEIPAPLYLAVAQVLAFVYQVRTARRRGARPPAAPTPEVPQELLDALRRAHKPL